MQSQATDSVFLCHLVIAVEKYELYAHEAVSEWIKKLAEFDGKPVDTTVYSELIAFENMGRMGFSKEFGVIRSGKRGRMQDLLRTMFSTSSALGELWWPIVLLNDLGITPAPAEEFFDLAIKLTEERMAVRAPRDSSNVSER